MKLHKQVSRIENGGDDNDDDVGGGGGGGLKVPAGYLQASRDTKKQLQREAKAGLETRIIPAP